MPTPDPFGMPIAKLTPPVLIAVGSWFPIVTAAVLAHQPFYVSSEIVAALWSTGVGLQFLAGIQHFSTTRRRDG